MSRRSLALARVICFMVCGSCLTAGCALSQHSRAGTGAAPSPGAASRANSSTELDVSLEPVGFRVDGGRVQIDLVLSGPAGSLAPVAGACFVSMCYSPAIWFEVVTGEGRSLELTSVAREARIQVDFSRAVISERGSDVGAVLLTVEADPGHELMSDEMRFRLRPDIPAGQIFERMGTVDEAVRMSYRTEWYGPATGRKE